MAPSLDGARALDSSAAMSGTPEKFFERVRAAVGEGLVPLAHGVVRADPKAEEELVASVLAGEESAQSLFLVLFFDFLVRDCSSLLGDEHLGEDAAVEAVCYLVTGSLRAFRPGEGATLWSWVRGAGRFKALSLRRKRRSWTGATRSLLEIADELADTEQVSSIPVGIEENEIATWVLTRAPLSNLQRELFYLRFVEGRTTAEAARALSISLATLHREQVRIREVLAARAEDFYVHGALFHGGGAR